MAARLDVDGLFSGQEASDREDLALVRVVDDVDALASVPELDLVLGPCGKVDAEGGLEGQRLHAVDLSHVRVEDHAQLRVGVLLPVAVAPRGRSQA